MRIYSFVNALEFPSALGVLQFLPYAPDPAPWQSLSEAFSTDTQAAQSGGWQQPPNQKSGLSIGDHHNQRTSCHGLSY